MSADFWMEGTFKPDTLVIHPGRAEKVAIKAGGGILKRGSVLGRVTTDRKYLLSLAAASDGSQVPEAILSSDVDATAADVEAVVYVTGTYNANVVTLGAGHTLNSVRDAFRSKDIYLDATYKSPV
jgi:hypothetical protein